MCLRLCRYVSQYEVKKIHVRSGRPGGKEVEQASSGDVPTPDMELEGGSMPWHRIAPRSML